MMGVDWKMRGFWIFLESLGFLVKEEGDLEVVPVDFVGPSI